MKAMQYIKASVKKWSDECKAEDARCRKGREILNARGETVGSDLANLLGLVVLGAILFTFAAFALGAATHAKDAAVEELNARFPRQQVVQPLNDQ